MHLSTMLISACCMSTMSLLTASAQTVDSATALNL